MITIVVSCDPPLPPQAGADIRNAANIGAAAELGRVVSVSLYPGTAAPPGIETRSLGERTLADCRRPVEGAAPTVAYIPDVEKAAFAACLAAERPDVVIVEGIGLAALVPIAASSGAKTILDMHNVESDLDAQIQSARRTLLLPPFKALRVAARRRLCEAAEREAVALVDSVWVCSNADAARLRRVVEPADLRVVANPMPRAPVTGPRQRPPDRAAPRLLFIGHLGYRPNVNAAERLGRQVFPRVKSALPGATLVIAGRGSHRRVDRLATAPGVTVLSGPAEVGPLLDAADFAVVPLAEGGGTRIKIVEAMAAGLVVVASRTAAEGLGIVDGVHAVIRDKPAAMAEEVVRLTRDPAAFLAMANAGRSWAIETAHPARHAEEVRRLLRSLVATPAGA